MRLARLLANVIATMYRQERVIRHRIDELAAVGDLASMLSGTANLKVVLDRTARRVAEVMRVKACAIRLLDESTGELVMSAVHNLSEGYLAKGPVLLSDNPVDKAAFDGQVVYIEDASRDARLRYPNQAQQEGIVSGLCVGMAYRGHYVGVLRVYTGEHKTFSKFEESLLKSIAAQAAAAIVNTRLFAQQREAERYHRQMEYAREIQGRMIPANAPRHRYVEFAGIYAPTLSVGGDFYDFFDLPWGNVGVCIADVVGKGIPAALMMASVRSVLRGHADSILDINDIITRVNRHMCRDTLIGEFCTLFYGVFSPDGGQLTYCNAGHDPPLLLRGGTFRALNAGGMVIGVKKDSAYEKEVIDLKSGDVLICYTDGVVDASDFAGTWYGLDRFKDSILRHADEPAGTLADQLKWDVRRFAGLAPQADDISIVVAKVQ